MIDNGFCFNAGEWNFPDAPLRGIYARHRVYEGVRGMEAFEPWLSRLEERIGEAEVEEAASEIPPLGMTTRPMLSRSCSNSCCGGGSSCPI
jgi:hypothetical protein